MDVALKYHIDFADWGSRHVAWGDLDGDGREDLLSGYCLIDDDGSTVWALDLPGHADTDYFADIDGDGRDEIVVLGGADEGVVLDLDGRRLWSTQQMEHVQWACSGKYRQDTPGLQTLFGERNEPRAAFFDALGRVLLRTALHGYGHTIGWPSDAGPESILCMRLARPDAPDHPPEE